MVSNRVESLDTSVLCRLILRDDVELFEAAMDLLERKDVTYKVSDAAVSEIVFVLTRMGVDRESIVGVVVRLLARPNIKMSDLISIELFSMYLEHPKLSWTDCYLANEAAIDRAEPLWTFDKALAKQSGTAKLVG